MPDSMRLTSCVAGWIVGRREGAGRIRRGVVVGGEALEGRELLSGLGGTPSPPGPPATAARGAIQERTTLDGDIAKQRVDFRHFLEDLKPVFRHSHVTWHDAVDLNLAIKPIDQGIRSRVHALRLETRSPDSRIVALGTGQQMQKSLIDLMVSTDKATLDGWMSDEDWSENGRRVLIVQGLEGLGSNPSAIDHYLTALRTFADAVGASREDFDRIGSDIDAIVDDMETILATGNNYPPQLDPYQFLADHLLAFVHQP